jgi:hypothetical protein
MIKKNADEEWTDISTRSIHQELMTHTIKLLGSEERARAMLAAGTLRLPPGNSAERKKAGGSPVAPSRVRPGTPLCQAPGNGRGGRCKLHCGMSTGPKTEQGRRRLQEAMKQRWLHKRSRKPNCATFWLLVM